MNIAPFSRLRRGPFAPQRSASAGGIPFSGRSGGVEPAWDERNSIMKIRRYTAALAAALLATAAPLAVQRAHAQDPAAEEVIDRREQAPFDALFQVRRELGLTDVQMGRLQAISQRLEETNRPLRAELVRRWNGLREQRRAELMRMSREQREAERLRIREQGPPPLPPEMRQLVARIRGNVGAAVREVGDVLTPAQKARVRDMMRERRQERRGMGGLGRQRFPRRAP